MSGSPPYGVYSYGRMIGREEGYRIGYKKGYEEGYNNGYRKGYKAGYGKAILEFKQLFETIDLYHLLYDNPHIINDLKKYLEKMGLNSKKEVLDILSIYSNKENIYRFMLRVAKEWKML